MYDPAYLCSQKQSALVVVDMQNDFVSDEGAFAQAGFDLTRHQSLEKVIAEMASKAREQKIPIVFLRMEHNRENDGEGAWISRRKAMGHPDSCREGTWGAAFYESLQPAPEDYVVSKHRYSGFVNTNLHKLLKRLKIETLVLAGINTNTCVESTARDAHQLGYHVAVVSDATASAFKDAYLPSLNNIERHFGIVITSSEWIQYSPDYDITVLEKTAGTETGWRE